MTKTICKQSSFAVAVTLGFLPSASMAQQLPPPPSSPSPVWAYEYDAEGNRTKTTAAPASRNFVTTQEFDNLGRLKSITDAKQGVVVFNLDLSDSLKAIADAGKVSTKYQVNGLGDVVRQSSTDVGTSTTTYDAFGNTKTRTDARGVLASFDYDELNRPKRLVFSAPNSSSRVFNWTYDQTGADFGYGVGRLTTAATPEVTTTMRYDALGRVTMTIQNAHVLPAGQRTPLVVNTDYDGVGHTVGFVYPSGRSVTYGWSAGQPTAVSLNVGNGSTVLLDQISISPIGKVKSWTWQLGGVARVHGRLFDTDGRLVRYPLGNLIRDVTYDEADRIAKFTHYIASTGQAAPSYDQSFGYDELNRLTTVSGATNWSYSYDPNGNRTSMTTGSGPTRNFSSTFDTNRLSTISNPTRTLTYDAAGNVSTDLQAGASTNYSAVYSLEGRLSEMSQGSTGLVKFSYDAFGRRIVRVEGGAAANVTVYAYDNANHLIGEYKADGTPISEYVWLADTPVAVIKGSGAGTEVFAVHADHLDTPRILMDTQWRVRWRWMGEPFGSSAAEEQPTANVAAVEQNLRFPGQQYEAFGGRHYNHFRDYDPTTGRYIQSDPIGLAGGINTYAYVGGNPLSFVDPNGLQASGGGGGGSGPCLDFDFDKFANQIEQNRSSTATDLAALGSAFAVGTMPKTPSELRGFGLSKEQMNPWTSQLSRWSSRLGTRELREIGRTVAGKAVSATATAALVVDGFYNWYVIGKAAIDATSSCGCKQ